VVGAIGPKIKGAEIERTKQQRPENLDGYNHMLRAQALLQSDRIDAGTLDAALVHLNKAIDLQPDYALAHALAAECYGRRYHMGATTDYQLDKTRALEFARRALALDKDDPDVLCSASISIGNFDLLEDAARLIERATNLNPNLSRGWYLLGVALYYLG